MLGRPSWNLPNFVGIPGAGLVSKEVGRLSTVDLNHKSNASKFDTQTVQTVVPNQCPLFTIANYMCNVLRGTESQLLSPPRRKQNFQLRGCPRTRTPPLPCSSCRTSSMLLITERTHTRTLYTGGRLAGSASTACFFAPLLLGCSPLGSRLLNV